jgi:hypothetical protein
MAILVYQDILHQYITKWRLCPDGTWPSHFEIFKDDDSVVVYVFISFKGRGSEA